ncbi:MAG TPA: M28 family peptidase [Xanthomonadales bacterium]|nr:M28 family peptidase [Xanthomonadales bacterium]
MSAKPLLVLSCLLSASVQAQVPPSEDLRLYDIGQATSAQRLQADIESLVGFGTRHSLSDTESDERGIGAARRWIQQQFEAISADCGGCLEVLVIGDTISGTPRIPDPHEIVSVIAIQRGAHDPNRMVMMSGDIDSRISDPMNAVDDSPGANDNASGMAGVIEAARVLTKYNFSGSIVYAALAGEEQGLFGGQIVAKHATEQGWNIDAVLNNDMIGNIAGINGVIDNHSARIFSEGVRAAETPEEATLRYRTGGEVDSASRNLARYIKRVGEQYIRNLDLMMVYRLDRFGRGGHHRPFNQAGFPGVRIMEVNEHYDRQHQDLRVEDGRHYGDTIKFVDFDFAAKLTALNAVSLASLAWAPAPPDGVEVEGMVHHSTTLSWEPGEDENLAGYRVYWRPTTAPEWTNSRYVGKVDHHTLDNVVIDNYFFGVASVAADGNESPVVFPGPAGAF